MSSIEHTEERPDQQPPRWWAEPRHAFLIGLGIGMVILVIAGFVVNRNVEYAEDHGLAAMNRWRPEQVTDFSCLIETIEASPEFFSVEGGFEFVPPANVSNEWFVFRTDRRTQEAKISESVLTLRAWPKDIIQTLDCNG